MKMTSRTDDRAGMFLEIGIWLLFFALLVPAGIVGYVIGRDARPVDRSGHDAPARVSAAANWTISGRAVMRRC
jgi:hypothetical protein